MSGQRKPPTTAEMAEAAQILGRAFGRTDPDDEQATACLDYRMAAANDHLQAYQANFERSKIPLYAWAAYKLCRSRSLSLPIWVAQYFDGVASRLSDLVELPPKEDISIAVAVAMGFPTGPKGQNFFRQSADAKRDAWCCAAYLSLQRNGVRRSQIWDQISKLNHRPRGTGAKRTIEIRIKARLSGFDLSLDDFEKLPDTDFGRLLLAFIAPGWQSPMFAQDSPDKLA